MANFNCCFCGDFFRKRTSGKGYEKRPLSSTLRGRTITALRAMQMIYDYKVQLNFSFSNESSSVYRNTVADYNVTHIYIQPFIIIAKKQSNTIREIGKAHSF